MSTAPQWLKADTEYALKLWKEGLSAGQIAQALDYKYTRNAVLGKMNRMGYARNPTKVQEPKRGRHPKFNMEASVAKKHGEGQLPASIANMLKITTPQVLEIMAKLGLDPRDNVIEPYRVHPMWSMDEDARRLAFSDKFRTGWAKVQERLRHG